MSSIKDARRIGLDFVGLIHGFPIQQLLPGREHNQHILNRLIHEALMTGKSTEVDDLVACARMHHFFMVVYALYDDGRLLSTAPVVVREAFIESLEIAEEATDLEVPEVLQ